MPNRKLDEELLAAALAPTGDCPPGGRLEQCLTNQAPAELKQHVEACPRCRAELHLLRSFGSGEVTPQERAAVDEITSRLLARSSGIFPAVEGQPPWWTRMLSVRWLTPAAATFAAALIAIGLAIQMRQGARPALDATTNGSEVLRSRAIAIVSPAGDLSEKPSEIRWEPFHDAARYTVRVMEVDRTELWSADTAASYIELPDRVKTVVVPAKTLLVQVVGFDANGRRIAESEPVRFRLLQNVYNR